MYKFRGEKRLLFVSPSLTNRVTDSDPLHFKGSSITLSVLVLCPKS